jgi:imidazoleglycerol phosphate synthase glutamine amidotransferase subunit HisH
VTVAIIDSGGANIASLRAALSRLGAESLVTSDPAVIRRDNFFGTQFHPERSGVVGARILANFLKDKAS